MSNRIISLFRTFSYFILFYWRPFGMGIEIGSEKKIWSKARSIILSSEIPIKKKK